MKLLFDQNLSPKLVERLGTMFPGSSHVQFEGYDCADDVDLWEHAKANGFAIVSKDSDFGDLSVLRGSPPKVVWLAIGNCTTAQVEVAIMANSSHLLAFADDPSTGLFVIK